VAGRQVNGWSSHLGPQLDGGGDGGGEVRGMSAARERDRDRDRERTRVITFLDGGICACPTTGRLVGGGGGGGVALPPGWDGVGAAPLIGGGGGWNAKERNGNWMSWCRRWGYGRPRGGSFVVPLLRERYFVDSGDAGIVEGRGWQADYCGERLQVRRGPDDDDDDDDDGGQRWCCWGRHRPIRENPVSLLVHGESRSSKKLPRSVFF
jgi:hypothetical protein